MAANGGLFSSSWSDLTGWLRGKPKEEDRRAENRLPVHEQATLTWQAESGSKETTPANLIDVSTLGFKVRCANEIGSGTKVQLTDASGKTAEGVVMHCERDDDGYLIGAQAEWETPEARSEATNRLAAQRER